MDVIKKIESQGHWRKSRVAAVNSAARLVVDFACVLASSISIDRQTGEIRLTCKLDCNITRTLVFVLLATDGANATATATFTINVRCITRGPTFSLDQYTTTVPELQTTLLPNIKVYVSSSNNNKKPSCRLDSRPYCVTADYLVSN